MWEHKILIAKICNIWNIQLFQILHILASTFTIDKKPPNVGGFYNILSQPFPL